jgi:hypothetical protein
MKKIVIYFLTSIFIGVCNAQCITGDCTNGYGTLVINDSTQISANFIDGWPDGSALMEVSGTKMVVYTNTVKGFEDWCLDNDCRDCDFEGLWFKYDGTDYQAEYNENEYIFQLKTIDDIVNDPPGNVVQSQEDCYYIFEEPELSFSFVDNRKLCCFCEKYYAKYTAIDDYTNQKKVEEAFYIYQQLKHHLLTVNADDQHFKSDFVRYTLFLNENYGTVSAMLATIYSGLGLVDLKLGQAFNYTPKEPSIYRNLKKYQITSNFCSNECASKCSYYEKDCIGCD